MLHFNNLFQGRGKIMKSSIIGSIFLGVLFLYGCDSGLNTLPTGTVAEDVYWEREQDALNAVNAVYRELDGQTMVKELDAVTDIGYRGPSGPGTLHDVGAGNISSSNNAITNIWDRYYVGIRKANDVINNIEQVEIGDPEVLSRIEAEARFLRAFFYTQLTSLWGDVPLIQEPLNINEHVGRTDKEEIVDFVISELDNVIDNDLLPRSYNSDNIGRATLGATYALKARIALRNNRWAMARDASQAVMDLDVYELYPDYEELFQYAGQNSSEIIFDRQYAPDGQTYGAFGYSAASIGGGSTVEPLHGLYQLMEFDGSENPDNPYENIDPRWNYTVYYTGQSIGNSTYNSRPDSETSDRVQSSESATQHGYNLKKWIDYENDNSNPSNGSINLILIRYADVLLMYAESKIELNEIDNSVYEAINEVRQRPTVDIPPITEGKSQAEMREIIRNERGVEFAFEGLRLFDMNRWGIGERKEGLAQGSYFYDEEADEWNLYDRGFNRSFDPDRDTLWPIPQSEINSNDEINDNNPGY